MEIQKNNEIFNPRGTGLLAGWMWSLLLLLMAALTWLFFIRLFAPQPSGERVVPYEGYDIRPLQEALTPEKVQNEQDKIISFGNRSMGLPGVYAAEEYIRETFKTAGLEVYEMENYIPAPHTIYREILDLKGTPLPDVDIYPFLPNHLQPIVTPEEGIEGKLLVITSQTLHTYSGFEDCIGLIDTTPGMVPEEFMYEWSRYAGIGLKAIIVSNPKGMEKISWHMVAQQNFGMVSAVPVNYCRLGATKEIFKYVGERIRLRVRVEFKKTKHTTLFGLLRAGDSSKEHPSRDAVLITDYHDACSILPDHSPGTLQAIGTATQLCLVKGLLPYKDTLKRDIMFISFGGRMMAFAGQNELMGILAPNMVGTEDNPLLAALGLGRKKDDEMHATHKHTERWQPLEQEKQANDEHLKMVQTILASFDSPGFLSDPDVTKAAIKSYENNTRNLFEEQIIYILNTFIFDLSEPVLQAKIVFEKGDPTDTKSGEFRAFMTAKDKYDDAVSAAGYTIVNLLRTEGKQEYLEKYRLKDRWRKRFEELLAHHKIVEKRLKQSFHIAELFDPYSSVVTIEPRLAPAFDTKQKKEILSIDVRRWILESQAMTFWSIMSTSKQRLNIGKEAKIPPLARDQNRVNAKHTQPFPPLEGGMWTDCGYPFYAFHNFSRPQGYSYRTDPVDLPFMRDLKTIRNSLSVMGETILSIAHGVGTFPGTQPNLVMIADFGGRVLVSNVGQSMVPNYPLKGAIIGGRSLEVAHDFSLPGRFRYYITQTDVYGSYYLRYQTSDFTVRAVTNRRGGHSPVAVGYGKDGLIAYIKDEGPDGQRLFKSIKIDKKDKKKLRNVTIVTFRAAPISITDMINPQTMKNYTDVLLVNRDGLAPFRKECIFRYESVYTNFVEPDQYFYVQLQAGTPGNELARVTRGFMLGITDDYKMDPTKEIDGRGYLSQETSLLLNVPFEVAKSMVYVNDKRLNIQNKYGMADERTNLYHEKSTTKLKESEQKGLSYHAALLKAREAVTYATLNHPVIRKSLFEAVLGILWYLALLVPFVFFFEKLVFGFTDIRKQLAVQGIVFFVVFGLLWQLHPAFQIVRSSMMILLGFIIILIAGGITLLFSGKFKENLEELRKKQGRVTAAEINKMGVMISAFMLGLNNMHRRKVRTGLTCATLILLTFVMICFTSVQTDLVDETIAVGKAPYQGFLIKGENFLKIEKAEVVAIRNKYGDDFDICQRKIMVGMQYGADKLLLNPELELLYEAGDIPRKTMCDSVIQFTHTEPLQDQITFLTERRWFTKEQQKVSDDPMPVFIPDTVASQLGISIERVNRSLNDPSSPPIEAIINGRVFYIRGIFDSASLNKLSDLDGVDLLPFDIESMSYVVMALERGNQILASVDEPRIPAERIILLPFREGELPIRVENAQERILSVVVSMPDVGYKEAKEVIDGYMEQTAQSVYYGLDGIAYKGKRTRETSMTGMIELLIPLIIAALTVLNTMKGSVYERRDEIYVYNAVGIAPRYVFFMFFAEAAVYAVVGSVLGYLVSQGTGRVLTVLNMTGGLNMTFTSITTIYASLTIAGAVFVSTYFPAKSAMTIATPAEEAGWSLPEPEGDVLEFDLPFTFNYKDRVAILAFFERFLQDHGEGSAGRFFAGPPRLGISEHLDLLRENTYIPQIDCSIWLKPFDLGVSQEMIITVPTDQETGEFKARITLTRLSGIRDAWLRLNHGFVAQIRRHFLHWRAVSPEEREEMFTEAKEELLLNT